MRRWESFDQLETYDVAQSAFFQGNSFATFELRQELDMRQTTQRCTRKPGFSACIAAEHASLFSSLADGLRISAQIGKVDNSLGGGIHQIPSLVRPVRAVRPAVVLVLVGIWFSVFLWRASKLPCARSGVWFTTAIDW